jgi:hypothetical protein
VVLNSKVEGCELDVPEHSSETVGTFDVLLLLGVRHKVGDIMQTLTYVSAGKRTS